MTFGGSVDQCPPDRSRGADGGLNAEPALAVGADRAGHAEGERQVVVPVHPERPLEPRPVLGHDDDPAAGHGLAVGGEQAAGHDCRVGGVGRSVLGVRGRRRDRRHQRGRQGRPGDPSNLSEWHQSGLLEIRGWQSAEDRERRRIREDHPPRSGRWPSSTPMRWVPSGPNRSWSGTRPLLESVNSSRPVVSQSLTVPSRLEVTIRAPSRLNAAARIGPVWPRRRASSAAVNRVEDARFHSASLGIEGHQAPAIAAESERGGRSSNGELRLARRRVEDGQGWLRRFDFVGTGQHEAAAVGVEQAAAGRR